MGSDLLSSAPSQTGNPGATQDLVLACSGVTKKFGGTVALSAGNLELRGGEVHALVGENGAGKSTLVKILSGVVDRDAGSVWIAGKEVDRHFGATWASLHGLRTVHQDQPVVRDLDVGTSVFLGREAAGCERRLLRSAELRRRAAELLRSEVGWDVEANRPGRSLVAAERVAIAIAGALAGGGVKALILDEPTAYLDATEARRLFDVVRVVVSSGIGVLYISHFIGEIFDLCDRVTVLRDGRTVRTSDLEALTPAEVVRAMVGRDVETRRSRARRETSRPASELAEACTVRALEIDRRVRRLDLSVRAGEVVALVGLAGSGIDAVGEVLGGAVAGWRGAIEIGGRATRLGSPGEAVRSGVVYVPRDRTTRGLFRRLTTRENIVARRLSASGRWGLVSLRRERRLAEALRERRRIRAASLEDSVSSLSGGNQQKVLLARNLGVKGALCVLDEPTIGVDVGARAEIYEEIEGLRDEGMGVVVVTADAEEALRVGDRVVAMYRGAKVLDIGSDEVSEGAVLGAVTGVAARSAADHGTEAVGDQGEPQGTRWLKTAYAALRRRQVASVVLALALLALLGARSPDYFSLGNWETILGNGASLGLLSVALCLTLMVDGFDMSVGGVSQLAGGLVATTAPAAVGAGAGIALASLLGTAVGVVFGVLAGICVAVFDLPGFIVTLGVLFVTLGLDLLVASGTGAVQPITETGALGWFGSQGVGGLSLSVVVLALVASGVWALARWTKGGLRLRAWESGSALLRVRGVSLARLTIVAYGGSGALAALSGVSIAIYSGGASSADNSLPLLLTAAAGAFLGRAFTSHGGFGLGAAFLGGIFVSAIEDGLIANGISSNAAPLVEGVVLLLAVTVGTLARHDRRPYEMGQVVVI